MKIKHLFPTAALALAMTACTADEMVSNPDSVDTPITYQAYTNNLTRAANSFCSQSMPSNFYVLAYWKVKDESGNYNSIQNYFYPSSPTFGDWIVADGNSWKQEETSVKRIWPKYNSLDFYAILDGSKTIETITTEGNTPSNFKLKVIGYDANALPGNQKDLMFAVEKDARPSESDNQTVTLNFHHALSQICFMAKNEDTQTTYKITQIKVYNVYTKGDFTFPGTSTTAGFNQHVAGSNENYSTNLWIDNSTYTKVTKEDSQYFINQTATVQGNADLDWTLPTGGSVLNISNFNEGSYQYSHNGDETAFLELKKRAMNLIPQSSSEIQVDITFTANGESKNETLTLSADWAAGKRYIYTLIFKPGQQIKYATTIADFQDDKSNQDI